MYDKTQWPESNHGFFMHPPLLKAVAGRPQIERHKGCSEKRRKSGQHLCPICKEYGHHWPKCKKGNKDDIAALMELSYQLCILLSYCILTTLLHYCFVINYACELLSYCSCREPPKKRRKTTKSAQSSIVPRGDEAPATAMYFPPRLANLNLICAK